MDTRHNSSMESQELIVVPAQRGPWGVTARLGGPPFDYTPLDGVTRDTVRQADAMLREGMILLSRRDGDEPVARAEQCFSLALLLLLAAVDHSHPLVAYAHDRVGYICQIQGKPEQAEESYLRARACDVNPPTIWNDVTLLNLSILYRQQGRTEEADEVMRDLKRLRERVPSDPAP